MNKIYSVSGKSKTSILILLFSVFVFCDTAKAQCPTIIVNASASPTSFCQGTTSQLSVSTGVAGGGYNVVQIPFAPVAGGGTPVTLGDDAMSASLPIGFNFNFFGVTYTQFTICSNGYISFNPLCGVALQGALPITNPNTMVAGTFVDLYPPGGGTIDYFTTGLMPNRKLIVNFTNIPHYGGANPITMQFILYESSNIIEVHHTSMPGGTNATEGIEDATGTNYLAVPARNWTLWTANNDAWQFSPGSPIVSYSWSPATGLSNPNIMNPVASPSSSILYTVTATDTNGCTGTAQVSLLVTNPPVTITATPDTVCAGSSSQLVAAAVTTSTTNYTVSQITYAPLLGNGNIVSLGDDQVSSMLPIGFTFSFYGTSYTQFNIGSNGFISFDAQASVSNYQGCCSGQILPSAANPNNLIAGAWEDLTGVGGAMNYFVSGTFPNRILVVNFTSVPHSPGVDPVTFQIQLYETSNIIEIHTASMLGNPGGYWWGHTEGIENATGTAAVVVPGRNHNNTYTATNDAWRFTPLSPFTYLWSPASTLSDDTLYNPVATPTANTTYSLSATDANGCIGNATITVYTSPLPSAPVVNYSGFTLYSTYGTGNQWYFNGNIITGATYQTYFPTQVGNYSVTYTDANGCTSSSAPYNVTAIGIDEQSMNVAVSVFPNPASGQLTVMVDNNSSSELIIYDITSRILFQQKFTSSLTFNTDAFANGIYIYEVKSFDKTRMTNTIVKKGKLEVAH